MIPQKSHFVNVFLPIACHILRAITHKTGLFQLDAEAVLRRTSPYRSTAERLKTAKSHIKMKKSVDFSTDFLILKNNTIFFS